MLRFYASVIVVCIISGCSTVNYDQAREMGLSGQAYAGVLRQTAETNVNRVVAQELQSLTRTTARNATTLSNAKSRIEERKKIVAAYLPSLTVLQAYFQAIEGIGAGDQTDETAKRITSLTTALQNSPLAKLDPKQSNAITAASSGGAKLLYSANISAAIADAAPVVTDILVKSTALFEQQLSTLVQTEKEIIAAVWQQSVVPAYQATGNLDQDWERSWTYSVQLSALDTTLATAATTGKQIQQLWLDFTRGTLSPSQARAARTSFDEISTALRNLDGKN